MKQKVFNLILMLTIIASVGFSQDNSLQFPGTSGTHIDLGSTMDIYNKQHLTVEMWVNPNNLSPADCFFSLPGSDYSLTFTLGTPWSMVRVEFGSGNTASTPSNILYNLEWFHLAFVFDGTKATDTEKVKIYINGLQQLLTFKKTIPTKTPAAPLGGVLIGEDNTSGKLFTGLMDNVAIWNTSRTGTEVQNDMNNHPDSEQSGLVSYLPMNETGSSTIAPDFSVNGNDGTLIGFPTNPSPWVTRSIVEPGTQAINITASNVATTQLDLSWTNGSGSSRIVFMAQTTTGVPAPSNNTSYIASAEFGKGALEPNGWYCIYNGTGNSVKVSGLTASTNYRVMVCEYNGSAGFENYNINTSTVNPVNVSTNSTPPVIVQPTIQASNLLCNATYTSCEISWTNGNGIKRLVFVKQNGAGVPAPANNTSYLANTVYGSGTQEPGGWFCVYNGTETSVNVTGLTAGATYRVMTLEYNGGAGSEIYNKNVATLNPLDFTKSVVVWNGNSSSDWGNTSNWAGGIVPGSNDDVFIPSGITNYPVIGNTTSANCKNLVVDASASLNINSAADGSSGSLIVGGTSTGNISFNRNLKGGLWHLVSSPVVGQNINNFVTSGGNAIAGNSGKYGLAPYNNATPGWAHFTSGTAPGAGNFAAGKGYEIMRTTDGLVSFTGTIQTSDINITIDSPGIPGNSWNLVGNPFTSAISVNFAANGTNNFITANAAGLNDANEAIYIWDASAGSYITVNQSSGATYVAPGQAFFVNSVDGGSSVDFTSAIQTHQNGSIFKSAEFESSKVKIIAGQKNGIASTNIVFMENTSTGLDPGYDAGRFNGGNNTFAVYTHLVGDAENVVDFDIQCLPNNDYNYVIPIGLNAPENTNVIFRAETINFPNDASVILEDKIDGTFTDLSKAGSFYSVNIAEKSAGTGRFFIHTQKSITAVNPISEKNDFKIIPQPKLKLLHINGNADSNTTISIFDLMGRKLIERKLSATGSNDVKMDGLMNGTYIVFIQSSTRKLSKKISWITEL